MEPHIGLSAQRGACFPPLSLPPFLPTSVLSVKWVNKIFKKKITRCEIHRGYDKEMISPDLIRKWLKPELKCYKKKKKVKTWEIYGEKIPRKTAIITGCSLLIQILR